MTKSVSVGIWKDAPFFSIIERGIFILNLLLKSKEALVSYKVTPINPKKLVPIDILFLDGGADINPERYGESNRYSYFNNRRDEIEFDLFNFYKNKTRISGVCRGHQLINVALNGTLFQDIYNDGVTIDKHCSPHIVSVINLNPKKKIAGFLSPFLDSKMISVSSLHHQCIARLGGDLYSTIIWENKDGGIIIEGIESTTGLYRGLQSHPEFGACKNDGYLFSYLLHVDTFAKDFFRDTGEKKDERSEGVS